MAQSNEKQNESVLVVKWWGVIIAFLAVVGWLFAAEANHEKRLTTIETQFSFIAQGINELKTNTSSMKDALVKHEMETRGRR